MPNFEHGLRRAISMIVESAIIGIFWSILIESGTLSPALFRLFNIISIISLVFFIDKTRYWGFGYLFGWIAGMVISLDALAGSELLSAFDIVLYTLVLFLTIGLRIYIRAR